MVHLLNLHQVECKQQQHDGDGHMVSIFITKVRHLETLSVNCDCVWAPSIDVGPPLLVRLWCLHPHRESFCIQSILNTRVETTVSDGRGIYVVRNKPSGGSRAVMVHQLNKSSWVPPSVHLEVSQAGIKKASIYQLKNMIFVQSPEWILAICISANHRYSCDLSFFWFLLFRLEIFLKVPEKCSVVSPVTNVKTHFWTVVTWHSTTIPSTRYVHTVKLISLSKVSWYNLSAWCTQNIR